jgi:tRNA A58 N-methylase Trm61
MVLPGSWCGAGSVSDWLCTRVGRDGQVVALDIDTRFVETLDHPNLETRQLDIATQPLEENQPSSRVGVG